MKYVYVLIDSDKDVVAIYENLDIAKKLKVPLEEKIGKTITIEERTLNPDISLVGVYR